MTISAYMSDVSVEIAFTSSFSTAEGDRVWTDVSQWVELHEGINIGYGRSDERSTADANTLSLTLDNTDGRFTPGRAASPYFPNVRLYRPIRVTATPVGGSASVRFTGYINQWPVAWDGSDDYASSRLTAVSRLSRLGLTDARRSVIEETYLRDGATAIYPLGEAEGDIVASDVAGKGAPPLTIAGPAPAIVFGAGTGVPSDGLSAPMFNTGEYLTTSYFSDGYAAASVEMWFLVTAVSGTSQTLLHNYDRGLAGDVASTGPRIDVDSSGQIVVRVGKGGSSDEIGTAGNYADNRTHHLVVTLSGSQVVVYVDGDEVLTFATIHDGPYLTGRLDLSGSRSDVNGLGGTLSQFATYDRVLTPAEIVEHYSAGLAAYVAETSDARLRRYASYLRIPDAEVETSGLDKTHIAVDTEGQGVVDLMRQIEVTESAVLHDRRDGHLALTAESLRYTATPAFTLDMAAQHVEADFAPQHDPSAILNDFTVSRVGGSPSARVLDTDSRDEYGVATGSLEVTSDEDDHPLQLASWQVGRYAEPKTRVPSITVDVNAQVGKTPSPGAILAADIHTLLRVVNQPTQAESTTADYFVEGYTETIGVASHFISFNVSAAEPFTRVFILNDPVRGVLDGSYVLGL